MDKFVTTYNNYTIWQLSESSLRELAPFVVWENYKHNADGQINTEFYSEIEAIYREEKNLFKRSCAFVAKNSDNKIIGSIRLINWERKQKLPIQKLFGIKPLTDISSGDSDTPIWHIGRLAVNTDIVQHGLSLFKLLLLYTMKPICESSKGIVFAECDSKLLRVMRLIGINSIGLGGGKKHLGSETIPVYANKARLNRFYNKYNHLYIYDDK